MSVVVVGGLAVAAKFLESAVWGLSLELEGAPALSLELQRARAERDEAETRRQELERQVDELRRRLAEAADSPTTDVLTMPPHQDASDADYRAEIAHRHERHIPLARCVCRRSTLVRGGAFATSTPFAVSSATKPWPWAARSAPRPRRPRRRRHRHQKEGEGGCTRTTWQEEDARVPGLGGRLLSPSLGSGVVDEWGFNLT